MRRVRQRGLNKPSAPSDRSSRQRGIEGHQCLCSRFLPTSENEVQMKTLAMKKGRHLLSQQFSALAARRSAGSFKKCRCLGPVLRDPDPISLGFGVNIGIFKSSPGDSNVRPRWKTTALSQLLHNRSPPLPICQEAHTNKIKKAVKM